MDKLTRLFLDLTPLPRDLCSIIASYLRSTQPWSIVMKNELLEDVIISDNVTTNEDNNGVEEENKMLVMLGMIESVYYPPMKPGFVCPAEYTVTLLEPNLSTNINFLQMIKTGYIHQQTNTDTITTSNTTEMILNIGSDVNNINCGEGQLEFNGNDDSKIGKRKFKRPNSYDDVDILGIDSFKVNSQSLSYYQNYNQPMQRSWYHEQYRQSLGYFSTSKMFSNKCVEISLEKNLLEKVWLKEEEILKICQKTKTQ
jgi:hypothetical protein